MSKPWTIGICSWSLQVKNLPELQKLLNQLSVSETHLALGDPHHASWDESDEDFIAYVKNAPFTPTASMLGFPGEDYTSPLTIQKTGGFGDPATRDERLDILSWGLKKTKALGLSIMSAHAGFIPEKDAPGRQAFMDCLKKALALAEQEGITLAFETGQETAQLLNATLEELSHPLAKINFDPANMLLYNKGDPIEAVKLLGPHIVHVHAKDAKKPMTPGQWGEEVPLGKGEVNFPAFLDALASAGYNGTLAIEREVGNQQERIADIDHGVKYLQSLIS